MKKNWITLTYFSAFLVASSILAACSPFESITAGGGSLSVQCNAGCSMTLQANPVNVTDPFEALNLLNIFDSQTARTMSQANSTLNGFIGLKLRNLDLSSYTQGGQNSDMQLLIQNQNGTGVLLQTNPSVYSVARVSPSAALTYIEVDFNFPSQNSQPGTLISISLEVSPHNYVMANPNVLSTVGRIYYKDPSRQEAGMINIGNFQTDFCSLIQNQSWTTDPAYSCNH